jgi:UDP-glucose 4-epimerase
MSKILVTGCAGLIGSHVVELLLDKGYDVIGVDDLSYGSNMMNHPKFKFVESKVQSFSNDNELDAVFHLATLKKPFNGVKCNSSDVMLNSVTMAENIKSICKSTGAFLIFSSTSDVYSNSSTFKETDRLTIGPPTIRRYSYAMTKLWEEQYYMDLFKEGYINGSIARIFGCTSPKAVKGWSGGHIPLFLDNAMRGEDIVIHGDGIQTRSIAHADTIAAGLIRMYEMKQVSSKEIFNLGSDKQASVRTAAELIKTITNSKSEIKHISTKEAFGDYPEIEYRFADTRKAHKILGVTFDDNLDDIIKEMYEAWKIEK